MMKMHNTDVNLQRLAELLSVNDNLEAIIHIQSDIIGGLLRLLGVHLSAEELDALPEIKKINLAAKLKEDAKIY